MIPAPEALAAMAAVVCPQDGGDPFGWIGGGELTPETPSRGATGAQSAELPPGGHRREPDGAERQTGVQRGRSNNSTSNGAN